MAILSIKADFGVGAADGTVFLGGTTALNLLGEVSAGTSVPQHWKDKLNAFVRCADKESFTLGGREIIKEGFYVKAKGIKFKETEHGAKGPAYWELAENVAAIDKVALAGQIRKLLAGGGAPCDPWVATLTAAMFLSEVVRNPRSFMINLMLLDLIEGGVKYGREANKELDFGKLLKFDSAGTDKVKTYTHAGSATTVGKGAEAGTVRGGKLPMSHMGAMEQYQQGVKDFQYKDKFDAYAKQSGLNLQAPSGAGVGYHFSTGLLEKECTVVLRWLLAYFGKKPLQHNTGKTEQKPVTTQGAWGKGASTTMTSQLIMLPITLTGRRDHVRDAAWVDAEGSDARASTLKNGAKTALKARQGGVEKLL